MWFQKLQQDFRSSCLSIRPVISIVENRRRVKRKPYLPMLYKVFLGILMPMANLVILFFALFNFFFYLQLTTYSFFEKQMIYLKSLNVIVLLMTLHKFTLFSLVELSYFESSFPVHLLETHRVNVVVLALQVHFLVQKRAFTSFQLFSPVLKLLLKRGQLLLAFGFCGKGEKDSDEEEDETQQESKFRNK